MKLYVAPFAPNPTKVELYLAIRAETGSPIKLERNIVNLLAGEHKSEAHLARNPFGSLPVLELEDGTILSESLVILTYFEDRFPDGALLSRDPLSRARALEVERIADVRLSAAIADFVHATRSPLGKAPNALLADEMRKRMEQPLDYFEWLLSDDRRFLIGAQPSIADCTLAAFLNFARTTEEDLIGSRRRLRDWQDRFTAPEAIRRALNR